MKKSATCALFLSLLSFLLSGCVSSLTQHGRIEAKGTKNLEYNAVLTDPEIKKNFKAMRSVAMNAKIENRGNNPYFDQSSMIKLQDINRIITDRLQNHYHLQSNRHRIQTYIGQSKLGACYQYYNATSPHTVGKICDDYSNCKVCNDHVNTIKMNGMRIIHFSPWWGNSTSTALVDLFKLRNGETVYFGLEITPV